MRSAKPKSCVFRTVPTLESRENVPKNQQMGLLAIKSSAKISVKIANMKKLFENTEMESESSASGLVRVGPMGEQEKS